MKPIKQKAIFIYYILYIGYNSIYTDRRGPSCKEADSFHLGHMTVIWTPPKKELELSNPTKRRDFLTCLSPKSVDLEMSNVQNPYDINHYAGWLIEILIMAYQDLYTTEL